MWDIKRGWLLWFYFRLLVLVLGFLLIDGLIMVCPTAFGAIRPDNLFV